MINIDEYYEKAVEKLEGSTLFGEPVDTSNLKEVAVAFYYMAEQERVMRESAESDARMQKVFAEHRGRSQ